MSTPLNIGVIFGGRSGEHEVSLNSARSVLSILSSDRYTVTPIGITHEGQWVSGENVLDSLFAGKTDHLTQVMLSPEPGNHWLYALRPSAHGTLIEPLTHLDVVFPVLHGTFGEDGTLQGFLELADIAYVGAGVLGSSVGMDKALFKDVMLTHGIPVVQSITVSRKQIETNPQLVIAESEALAGYPLFVKPANLGSSVGISKCRNRSDLLEGLMEAARFDRRVLIERGIHKPREIEFSVLGNDDPIASIPGEIIPSDDFYSYRAKYIDGDSALIIPAELPEEMVNQMRTIAVKAYKAIDCAGMARVDFLIEGETNRFYLSEVNTIPGFTSISMYPKLWEASGLSYANLVERLIELALERKADRDHTERKFDLPKKRS